MSRCVILQSNYIPWKGYFDLINEADTFVFHDDLQYTKRDWRNRNILKSKESNLWLSIPVGSSEKRLIDEVRLPEDNVWRGRHRSTIEEIYGGAKYFEEVEELIFPILMDLKILTLSELNRALIIGISEFLGIDTTFTDTRVLSASGDKVGKLVEICRKVDADTYLSGPAAKNYIGDEFGESGISLQWMEYGPYPEYDQFGQNFEHAVSIIDLIAHTGLAAADHIW